MAKISTQDIKKLIPSWLGTETVRNELREYHIQDDETEDDELQSLVEENNIKVKKPYTKDNVRQAIFDLFCSEKEYSRTEKRKITDDWDTYFYPNESKTSMTFASDFAGGSEQSLVNDLAKEESRMQKCWLRVFSPKNELLGDNFRLEVVTTPEDDKIVGWLVVVD